MKTITLNREQRILLRRKTGQKKWPKRLHICKTVNEYMSGVLGEYPITYPYRTGDDVFMKFNNTAGNNSFLKELRIVT